MDVYFYWVEGWTANNLFTKNFHNFVRITNKYDYIRLKIRSFIALYNGRGYSAF